MKLVDMFVYTTEQNESEAVKMVVRIPLIHQ